MISSPAAQRRLMVPRWRSLRLTNRSGELSAPGEVGPMSTTRALPIDLRKRLERWRLSRDPISAAELIEAALIHGEESEGAAAAKLLLSEDGQVTPSVEDQAVALLRKLKLTEDIPERLRRDQPSDLHRWRYRTKVYPHDAIGWMELALVQTTHGGLDHARRSVAVAVQLAPNNRHVLRSAARFHLHNGDPEFAHALLAKADATKGDPWLIASEIALARLAEKPARFYKQGLAMLEKDDRIPRQITELAGSVATNELIEGNRKKARRFFRQSMTDPNGNALAQAEWASPVFGTDLFRDSQLQSVSEPHEARAFHEYREGRFEEVLVECESWALNEPYSIRPFELAASAAGVAELYDRAAELALRGLRMRPRAGALLNSRAYALASLGDLEGAEEVLVRIREDADIATRLTKLANLGFIALHRRQKERGMAAYEAAINGFKSSGKQGMPLYATTYFARALALSGYFAEAEQKQDEIRRAIDEAGLASTKRVFRSTELLIAAHKLMLGHRV